MGEFKSHTLSSGLFGCFGKRIDGPGLPGGLLIYQGYPSISSKRTPMEPSLFGSGPFWWPKSLDSFWPVDSGSEANEKNRAHTIKAINTKHCKEQTHSLAFNQILILLYLAT